MIAVCTTCHKLFETTQEDAYTPGVQCAPCYREERGLPPMPAPAPIDPDFEQAPNPDCPHCGGTGWVTVTDHVDYGSTTVAMEFDEPCACTYADAPQTAAERAEYEAAYTSPVRTPRDPDGARWMALGWDSRAGEWR